jgi:hypothetical protein
VYWDLHEKEISPALGLPFNLNSNEKLGDLKFGNIPCSIVHPSQDKEPPTKTKGQFGYPESTNPIGGDHAL